MVKREKYSHAIADEHSRKKRKEAELRQQARAKRTAAEQLHKLDAEHHTAAKERARLKELGLDRRNWEK